MTTNQTKHFVLDRLLKMALRRETSFSGYASFNGAGVRFATDVPLRTRPALGGPPPGYIRGRVLLADELLENNDPGPPRGKRWLQRIYDWTVGDFGYAHAAAKASRRSIDDH